MRAGSDRARRSVRIGKIMELTDIRELHREKDVYIGKEITVGGWVRNNRDSKNFGFLVINDGTFFEPLQVVYGDGLANFQEICKINVGAAVVIRGTIVATPEAKQAFEMQAAEVIVEGPSTADYPLQKKRHSFEYLRTISHLRARTNTFQAVFRVRSLIAYAIHTFFMERGFVYVHTPLITSSDCEGAGEMFQVTTLDMNNVPKTEDGKVDYTQDFFGKPVNLTVSGQLDVETYAFAFKNVYTFGPTFRAENSNTTRHAAEFWMIEPEICFADLKDDMILAESMLKYVIRYVLENAPEEMAFFNQFVDKGLIERLQHVVNSDFGHVTYTEAIKILEKHNDEFDYKVFWGCDLQTEHERYLTEKEFKRPVFVTDDKCFRFIHLVGAHSPWHQDAQMNEIENGTYEQSIEASMTIVATYLQKLKDSGVYDNTAIMILSDHGYNIEDDDSSEKRQHPILFVKGVGEHYDELQISSAPISQSDYLEAYTRLLDGKQGDAIFDYKEGDARERRFLFYDYDEPTHFYEYMQTGYAGDVDTMYFTGVEITP